MNSSASDGSRTVQSASLPGRVEFSSADLRRVRSRALRAAWRARAASTDFETIRRASAGCSSRNSPSLRLTVSLTRPSTGGLPSFVFVWPSNCGLGELHRDHRGQPLADVVAGQVLVLFLQQPLVAGVGVQRPGERRAEAGEVRAALVGVDVVGEREHRLLVGGVPLHRDLDRAVLGLVLEEDGLAVQGVLVLVQVLDEVDDPALVEEGVALAGAALVDELDLQAAGQERGLAHPLGERLVVELERLEDLVVGKEGDRRPGALELLAALQVALRLAALVVLGPLVAVAAHLEVEALGERVDDRDADPVQAAGDLVAAALAAELAAGVQGGQHDLGRRALLLRVLVDRDPAAVVGDGDAVVGMQRELDPVAVAGERLVDGVVDDLVDEVMEAARAGRADVHAGALAHRVEAAQDGDLSDV